MMRYNCLNKLEHGQLNNTRHWVYLYQKYNYYPWKWHKQYPLRKYRPALKQSWVRQKGRNSYTVCCNRPNNEHVIMEQQTKSDPPRLPKMLGLSRRRRTQMMFQGSAPTGRERISSICGGRVVSPNYTVSSRRLAAPWGIRPVVTVIKKTDANCRYASCTQFHAPASQRTV